MNIEQLRAVMRSHQDQDLEHAKATVLLPDGSYDPMAVEFWETITQRWNNPVIELMSRFAMIGMRHVIDLIESQSEQFEPNPPDAPGEFSRLPGIERTNWRNSMSDNKFSDVDRRVVIDRIEKSGRTKGKLKRVGTFRKVLADEANVFYVIVGGQEYHGIQKTIVDAITAKAQSANLVVALKNTTTFIADFTPFAQNKAYLLHSHEGTKEEQYQFHVEIHDSVLRVREIPNYFLEKIDEVPLGGDGLY